MARSIAILLLVLGLLAGAGALGDDAAAPIREGQARLDAGEIDAALALFRRAAEADPSSSLAHTRIGGALLLKRDYGGAVDAFRTALARDPQNADAFVGLALAHLHGGDYPLARAALEEAKRIDPAKGPQLDALLGWIDERAGSAPGEAPSR